MILSRLESEYKEDLDNIFLNFQSSFDRFRTETKRLSYFEKKTDFIKNKSISVTTVKSFKGKKKKKKRIPKLVSTNIEIVPLITRDGMPNRF